MHSEKISEIVAHFIGYFDAAVDDTRMRSHLTEGAAQGKGFVIDPQPDANPHEPASGYNLQDYDPHLRYVEGYSPEHDLSVERHHGSFYSLGHSLALPLELDRPYLPHPIGVSGPGDQLVIHPGPGSVISHYAQANLLQDDDFLDFTSRYHVQYDMSFVMHKLADYTVTASGFVPLGDAHRTDTPQGIQNIAQEIHDFAADVESGKQVLPDSIADDGFVLSSQQIDGTFINGEAADTPPSMDDYLPDRGLAALPVDPVPSDTSLELHGPGDNSLEATGGANLVGNYASIADANLITPVMSVFGDYHQADVINQAYIYSDTDHNNMNPFQQSAVSEATTVAMNIASFNRHSFDSGDGSDTSQSQTSDDPGFPQAWRVSVIDGDVSFVQWMEQYNFVCDNDQMTVTTMGCEVTALSGGNTAVNLASFFGIGQQYDLVIVGGNVYDMNVISQISVLYDNDWVSREGGAPSNGDISTSNNLLWNEAAITNVGSNDRFEAMPDYMVKTVQGIQNGDPNMPHDLATDPNFAGYEGLNVLYITGNLYDLNYIKQVSVLGDSDMVTRAASEVVNGDDNATVDISTGNNTVFNLAQIVDYDSFGDTTYLDGNLYSDAVLIQGGLVENDHAVPQPGANTLANEVIAFLGDDVVDGQQHSADPNLIISHDDISWNSASPADAMQTVVA